MISSFFFFFNDTATTEIYTLSLHDALPICLFVVALAFTVAGISPARAQAPLEPAQMSPRTVFYLIRRGVPTPPARTDRKSTRLNSSHGYISYAVFCLKKKKRSTTPRSCPPT